MEESNIIINNLQQITSGGEGRIYIADMEIGNNSESIRVIAKDMKKNEKDIIDLFKTRNLRHENIVPCYGWVSSPQDLIVMEYSNYGDLENFIQQSYDNLKVQILVKIRGLVNGIDYLHSHGILHLDLHPKNIIVKNDGDCNHLKICDFGLSKTKVQNECFDRLVHGRPGYVSPEKVRAASISEDTDIWSLGCILWKIFTTKEAYKMEHPNTIYYTIGDEQHPYILNTWPLIVQELLFLCWDSRQRSDNLLKLFKITMKNELADELLLTLLPLSVEYRYVPSNAQRIMPSMAWKCSDKYKLFESFQFTDSEFCNLKDKFCVHICKRKFAKIETPKDLFICLNECGFFKDFMEFKKKVFNETDMGKKFKLGLTKWIRVARTLGMPDQYIFEIRNEDINYISDEVCQFWSTKNKKYSFDTYGIEMILQFLQLD